MSDDIEPSLLAQLDQRMAGADEALRFGRKLRCGCTRYQGRVALIRWRCWRHMNWVWRFPYLHPIAWFATRNMPDG